MINITMVLPPPHAHDAHSHDYTIVLADMETGNGYELSRFEAPCVVTDERANLSTIIAALRDTADQLADAHADILAPPLNDDDAQPADDQPIDEGEQDFALGDVPEQES